MRTIADYHPVGGFESGTSQFPVGQSHLSGNYQDVLFQDGLFQDDLFQDDLFQNGLSLKRATSLKEELMKCHVPAETGNWF